ncbi:MAG: hypothetical protein A2Z99_14340 [Treponema sp. GWB1_62_6]|nr:MAG: hypothetical protein A2Z99_14340 [Treponema sp. GWB1_62_6]OHE69023.1 MAG: hypothetical protein A2413_04495 [Treponema sp. RIFOXYC1_FULL_61_9]HCM25609.1 hypothetical protein [Treponema sp.]
MNSPGSCQTLPRSGNLPLDDHQQIDLPFQGQGQRMLKLQFLEQGKSFFQLNEKVKIATFGIVEQT